MRKIKQRLRDHAWYIIKLTNKYSTESQKMKREKGQKIYLK